MTTSRQAQTRRLARFGGSVCGATGMVFWCRLHCFDPSPPTPPYDGNPARLGTNQQEMGSWRRFSQKGRQAVCEKPVQLVSTTASSPISYRTPPALFYFRLHPLWSFLHGFRSFLHGRLFHDLPVYISLLPIEREREEGQKSESPDARVWRCLKNRLHGFFFKTHRNRARCTAT